MLRYQKYLVLITTTVIFSPVYNFNPSLRIQQERRNIVMYTFEFKRILDEQPNTTISAVQSKIQKINDRITRYNEILKHPMAPAINEVYRAALKTVENERKHYEEYLKNNPNLPN
ncbi:MAG TPA: hypothetical protein VLG71_01505 [Candidatus Limnocylindria bacterium]|nr:hypothetical protein [Candidatus Limnocylindria bacterium]